MSSVPSPAGDLSTPEPNPNHGFPFEQQTDPLALLEENGLALSRSESRPDALAEIQRLLAMPDIDIPPEDRANTPVQMSITLMEHQKIALKWLKDQESNLDKKGGLLADTMGLGKTIEALALIVANKPPAFGPKTTLIVAPLALLRQWKREIEDKLKPAHRLAVFIYHGREKKTKSADRLYDYDVVLTTYETIAYEYNSKGPDGRRRSLLFTHPRPFYRIILDEAHKIKNRNTACSKAVVDLRAEFRLCMTGTPFMNNTGEIFSLVRFLRIAPYCDWKHFSHDIETPLRKSAENEKGVPMRRLQALFRSITLRRTKDSVLDGRPILTLPELTITATSVELDKDQRDYYMAIEKKHQLLVNKYLKHNKLHRVITYILVLLTRLRQVCDHPFLIKNHGIPDEATLNSKQMVQLSMRLNPKVVSEVMRKKEFQCPLCDEPVEIPIIISPCGHDICPECFSSMMQVGSQATRNAEDSQLGLPGFISVDADLETKCPYDDCQSEILPNKVVCHDHFLDAHSLGGASRVQKVDSSDDESEDCCSSDDDEENSDDDDGDLADFIVPDGEDESEADSDESESDDQTESASRSKLQISEGSPAPVDQAQTPDTLVNDYEEDAPADAVQDTNGRAPSAEEVEGEDMASNEDVASQSSQGLESTPDPFVIEDMGVQQSPIDQPTPADAGILNPALVEEVLTLGNDVWGHALSRLREGEHEQSDAGSDSDLESLSETIAKVKAKPTAAAAGSSRQVAGTGKRMSKPSSMPVKKRARKWDESESEERPRKARKGRKEKKKSKKNKKGKRKSLAELKKAGSTSKAGKLKYFDRLRRDWESSAKVDVTIDLLRKIRSERPTEKTLVFSLWTSFLDLLEIPMQDEKFTYLRYDGGMTFNERDDNVKTFSEDPRENILLVSLMAGNAGLNLTAASRVIILEPFWNPFVEDQAIDRAHRIGQDKKVRVYRLLVPDSVEDRILALQEKKRKLVNTALSEEGAQGVGRLSIGELRGLFGLR